MNVYALSKSNDLLAKGLEITVNLLRFAELSNFYIISSWISVLNPDLWVWNELAKYLPAIQAAQNKYESIGTMAPRCKTILPPQEVLEFQAQKLSIPFSVARRISIEYGNGTLENLQGDNKTPQIRAITDHALYIVRMAGGARTIDTIAIRAWRYNGYQNPELYQSLNKGALIHEIKEEEEDQV